MGHKKKKTNKKQQTATETKKSSIEKQRARGQGLNADFRSRRAAENRRRPFGRDKNEIRLNFNFSKKAQEK